MKLPNASEAEVPEAKIVRYLLNPNHRSGKSKAQFFLRHGFRIEEWAKLATTLRQHASENEVTRREPTPLGERFVIDGLIALAGRLQCCAWYGLSKRAKRLPDWQPHIPSAQKEQHSD